ncbi:MAG: deoxyribodipyrimidine photolyase, partial [Gammaproteobacteria bacterium]|nr:deoxyribodipyrimidine photolyase [Gammaproteobacteria bacterium]
TASSRCSRISPYLAFGSLSMREVWQACRNNVQTLADRPPETRRAWRQSLKSFDSRLHWHCHFIQKLEDEPAAEFRSFHSAYHGLDKEHADASAFLAAWQEGRTGYPLVDACMRSLAATGWLTFRMRAMVMSFAAYHLWLDWRAPALHLARNFTDYEPGIHYSQCQMQSGITGINTIRIYNPIKQSQEQDRDGTFIRKWVHELAGMPDTLIHTPWLKPDSAPDYPPPLVEERAARRAAADAMFAIRKSRTHANEAAVVVERHGSRNSRNFVSDRNPRRRSKAATEPKNQLELDFQHR